MVRGDCAKADLRPGIRVPIAASCTNCLRNTTGNQTLKLLCCGRRHYILLERGSWVQCQREHWPQHKECCNPPDGSGIRSIVTKFISSRMGCVCLQICMILHFDLLHNPQLGIHQPCVALLDFGIEPVEIKDFFDILLDQPLPSRIKGMLQVNNFEVLGPAETEEALKPAMLGCWNLAREECVRKGLPNTPVGLVKIGNAAGGPTAAVPVVISEEGMELARQALKESSFTAFDFLECVSVFAIFPSRTQPSVFRQTNTFIREDIKNTLRLRKNMEASDIDAIKALRRDIAEDPYGQNLLAKMEREAIFQPMIRIMESVCRKDVEG
ncbi:hypothetical protein B0H16DRAFT_1764384 [Mycena metata]|uniref:DUF8205 domain-containing protein n=1 Tax=Mycena metata TaxID=1033252 RepID=A0AAD7I7H5_9AGAR|nr:hypothetical protein B0H16DRAFT_1764384 [Mycena metata]